MKKKKTIIGLMIGLLVGSALLAGCGSSKEAAQSNEKTEFVYAMSGLFKPFNYKENGKLTGFDVEIGEALSAKMGLKPSPITFPWETIIQGLIDKKYDAILGSMSETEERKKVVAYTEPYYKSGSQIFVLDTNNDIKSKEDVKGKKIGTTPATIYEKISLTLTDKDKVMLYSQGDMSALMDLASGRIDAVICDDIFGKMAMSNGGLKIKPAGERLDVDAKSIAVNKDNPEMVEKLNKALNEIISDGTYEKISKKWFGYNLLDQ